MAEQELLPWELVRKKYVMLHRVDLGLLKRIALARAGVTNPAFSEMVIKHLFYPPYLTSGAIPGYWTQFTQMFESAYSDNQKVLQMGLMDYLKSLKQHFTNRLGDLTVCDK